MSGNSSIAYLLDDILQLICNTTILNITKNCSRHCKNWHNNKSSLSSSTSYQSMHW